MKSFYSAVLISMFPLLVVAQNTTPIVDAWDVQDAHSFLTTTTSLPQHFLVSLSNSVISLYQKDISIQSVSRCPFEISCSHFAKRSISEYGIIGVAMFVDRYFYRENIESFINYKLIKTKSGILKLDDKLYLFD